MMTLDEAIERYTNNAEYERTHGSLQGCLHFRQLVEWLKDYKRLLEQEPCEDCISRQAVLELVADYDLSMGQVVKGIHALPPVTPQPRIAHWIEDEYEMEVRCSECGEENDECSKYCPKCGAKMQTESEDKE